MAAEVTVVSNIAGRYASALFELALDGDNLEIVEADLKAFREMYKESADLRRLLRSPVFGYDEQWVALQAVLSKAEFGPLTSKFIGLVTHNRRAFALCDMAVQFAALLAQHRGEVVALVTTALELDDSQVSALKAELSAAMKTDVIVETAVDETILGGLIVRVGSRMVDSSLRTKLQNIGFAMRGVE